MPTLYDDLDDACERADELREWREKVAQICTWVQPPAELEEPEDADDLFRAGLTPMQAIHALQREASLRDEVAYLEERVHELELAALRRK